MVPLMLRASHTRSITLAMEYREGMRTMPLYSPAWTAAFLDTQNACYPIAMRELRQQRARSAPMRIRVEIRQDWGNGYYRDECVVYGWRAALVAIRAMGASRAERTTHYEAKTHAYVADSRLMDAIEEHG
jgi:hypothetical protein